MQTPHITVLTADVELGSMLQLYLEERGFAADLRFPWSDTPAAASPSVVVVDARDRWARETSNRYGAHPVIRLVDGAQNPANSNTLVLPVKARRLRRAIEAQLRREPSQVSTPHEVDSSGRLGRHTFARTAAECRAERFSGKIVVTGARERVFWMEDGLVVAGRGGGAQERLAEVLLQRGAVQIGDLPVGDLSEEALAETLLGSGNLSVDRYLDALEWQLRTRLVCAMGEVAPTVIRHEGAAGLPEEQRRRPISWIDALIDAQYKHRSPNEVARMIQSLQCSGLLVPTELGMALKVDLADHRHAAAVWRRSTEGRCDAGSLAGEVADLYVLAALIDGGVLRLDYGQRLKPTHQ